MAAAVAAAATKQWIKKEKKNEVKIQHGNKSKTSFSFDPMQEKKEKKPRAEYS